MRVNERMKEKELKPCKQKKFLPLESRNSLMKSHLGLLQGQTPRYPPLSLSLYPYPSPFLHLSLIVHSLQLAQADEKDGISIPDVPYLFLLSPESGTYEFQQL